MTDLLTATKDALVARLQGAVGAPVFDHVPDGQQPPVVVLDRIDSEDAGGKDGGLIRALVTVQVIAQGRSRDPFRAIVSAVRQRLDGFRPPATAQVLFGDIGVSSTSETTLGDGLTHLGDISAELFVQPA
jgi:hypothetical protein